VGVGKPHLREYIDEHEEGVVSAQGQLQAARESGISSALESSSRSISAQALKREGGGAKASRDKGGFMQAEGLSTQISMGAKVKSTIAYGLCSLLFARNPGPPKRRGDDIIMSRSGGCHDAALHAAPRMAASGVVGSSKLFGCFGLETDAYPPFHILSATSHVFGFPPEEVGVIASGRNTL
jgi:hypothetical protein